ncbi:MAG: hypothetical protein QNL04_13665 [SAR324 cluster bacterium]|nr:hypothetical protein [SAR324 cluster bacterium]
MNSDFLERYNLSYKRIAVYLLAFIFALAYLKGHPLFNYVPQGSSRWSKAPAWLIPVGVFCFYLGKNHPSILALLISIFSFRLGILQSQHSIDPHHWGLFLSEALDLLNGKVPFKEISMFYGLFTPGVFALSFLVFGKNLLSLGIVTSVAYSTTLFLSYRIWTTFLTKQTAVALTVVLFLLHPNIIYPWPNYLAYTLQLFGIWFLIKGHPQIHGMARAKNLFTAGFFFGFAILARDGVVIAISVSLFLIGLLNLVYIFHSRKLSRSAISLKDLAAVLKPYTIVLIGLGLPLAVFFLYLETNDLLGYWYRSAVDVKQFFIGKKTSGFILSRLLKYFYSALDPVYSSRYKFIVALIFYINIIFFCLIAFGALLYKRISKANLIPFAVGTFALCSLANSVHLQEIFRMQNGLSIGLGVVVYFLAGNAFADKKNSTLAKYNFATLFISFAIGALIFGFAFNKNKTNYFPLKKRPKVAFRAADRQRIPYFAKQKWPKMQTLFYTRYRNNFRNILRDCHNQGIYPEYFSNLTIDAFFTVISPLPKMHLTPWHSEKAINLMLQPHYPKLKKELEEANKIIWITEYRLEKMSEGYMFLKSIPTVSGRSFAKRQILYFAGPKECYVAPPKAAEK